MTPTVIESLGAPQTYLGDLDRIEASAIYYSADERTFTRRQLHAYMERHSRTAGSIRTDYTLDKTYVDYKRQYGLRFSFHNYTNADIMIVDRLGLPVTIKPEKRKRDAPASAAPALLIRREMYFDSQEVSFQTYANIQTLGKLHGAELTRMMPELGRHVPNGLYGRSVSLEYEITESEIRAGDGRLYHLPTDMVISYQSAAQTLRHPCSPEYFPQQDPHIPNYPMGERDVHVSFRYINANPKAPAKYVRLANHVFALQPEWNEPARILTKPGIKDKPGVEEEMGEYIEMIYEARMDAIRDTAKGWRCLRLTLEEARTSYEIYDTADEARNPHIVAERKEQKHRDDIAKLETKHSDILHSHLITIANQEAQLRRREAQIDDLRRARDLELERIKEQNERASHTRRISSENIKLLTGVATAAVTIYGLWLKYRVQRAES